MFWYELVHITPDRVGQEYQDQWMNEWMKVQVWAKLITITEDKVCITHDKTDFGSFSYLVLWYQA